MKRHPKHGEVVALVTQMAASLQLPVRARCHTRVRVARQRPTRVCYSAHSPSLHGGVVSEPGYLYRGLPLMSSAMPEKSMVSFRSAR